MRIRKLAALVAVAFLFAPSSAYVVIGPPLHPKTHLYRIDVSNPLPGTGTREAQVEAAILGAQEWGLRAGADFRLVFDGLTEPPYDPWVSVLVLGGPFCLGMPTHGLFATCLPSFLQYDTSGNPPLGTFDLQGSVTHHLGHAIGFGHSKEFDATMAVQPLDPGALNFRTIESDDVDAVAVLYGLPQPGRPILNYQGVPFRGRTILLEVTNATGLAMIGMDVSEGPTYVPGLGEVFLGMTPQLVLLPGLANVPTTLAIPDDPGFNGRKFYLQALVVNASGFALSNPSRVVVPF